MVSCGVHRPLRWLVRLNHVAALNGFDPNANGMIRAVVAQADGKILIGGDFTMLLPNGGATITRNYIARLNPDGTLDTTFNPTPPLLPISFL